MNVLTAAWLAAGSPAAATTLTGSCARCGGQGDLATVRSAVSKQFTAFDTWINPSGRGLCPQCTWGYATASLRSGPHLVTRTSLELRPLTRAEAAGQLRNGPLGPDVALVVPLRPGRKHLLPDAEWGRVAVDDAQLAWDALEVHRLHLVDQLRELGFGTRMLTAPAPPFQALTKLPTAMYQAVLDAWDGLEAWRQPDNPWMALALHLTTPTTQESR
ncbi:MAG: hypothetical protein ACRCYU_13095 [Nocardioides sp.]